MPLVLNDSTKYMASNPKKIQQNKSGLNIDLQSIINNRQKKKNDPECV